MLTLASHLNGQLCNLPLLGPRLCGNCHEVSRHCFSGLG